MLALLVEHRRERGIGAHSVIVPVSADECTVEPDVARGEGGNGGQLCGEEVLLAHAVRLVEVLEHGQLDLAARIAVGIGQTAHDDVELLALDDLSGGLTHLLLPEVGKQVVDIEDGILGILADPDLHFAAVL